MSVPFSARGNQGCLQEPGLNVAWCKTTPLASQHASCMLEGYGSALKGNEQRGLVITATVTFAAWSKCTRRHSVCPLFRSLCVHLTTLPHPSRIRALQAC